MKDQSKKYFVSCHLMGGLGNQLFQVATTFALAKDSNNLLKEEIVPIFPFLTDQNVSRTKSYKDNILRKIHRIQENIKFLVYKERWFPYQQLPRYSIEYKDNNLMLDGYWQSYKYFDKYRDELKELFSPRDEDLLKIKQYDFKNSLSIHLRRGDYLNHPTIHLNLPISYYEEAFGIIKNFEIENIYIFSDDIKWCKNHLTFIKGNKTFVEEEDYIELYIMWNCNYHIIANSSFSWWGAYLSNSKKVICPKRWFEVDGPKYNIDDIIPAGNYQILNV
jgi:hypothetical protein